MSDAVATKTRDDYIAENPDLAVVEPGKYNYAVIAGKNMRIELKKAFPLTTFRVYKQRTQSYYVSWNMGPSEKEVRAICEKYEDTHFDAMQDLPEHKGDRLWHSTFGSCTYLFVERNWDNGQGNAWDTGSPDNFMYQVCTDMCKHYGMEYTGHRQRFENGEFIETKARQLFAQTSFYNREYAGVDMQNGDFVILTKPVETRQGKTVADNGEEATITIRRNLKKKGIEVVFSKKPEAIIIDKLRGLELQFSPRNILWYTKYTPSKWEEIHEVFNLVPPAGG